MNPNPKPRVKGQVVAKALRIQATWRPRHLGKAPKRIADAVNRRIVDGTLTANL